MDRVEIDVIQRKRDRHRHRKSYYVKGGKTRIQRWELKINRAIATVQRMKIKAAYRVFKHYDDLCQLYIDRITDKYSEDKE